MRWWSAFVLVVAIVVAALGVSGAGAAQAPVTAGGVQAGQPSVSGTRVAWADYRGGQWDIWLYDAMTKRARRVTSGAGDKVQPSLSGDKLVFVSYSASSKGDVWVYDITSGESRCLSVDGLGKPLPGDQLNPVIDGPWVAWEDLSSAYNNSKIYAYNLEAATGFQVAGQSSRQFRRPRISGNSLVYESAARDFGQSDIMLCDLALSLEYGGASVTAVSDTTADERLPVTDGRYVVWIRSQPGSGYDIVAKDLQTAQEFVVSAAPGEQTLPVIAGGKVYWTDSSDGVAIRYRNLDGGATALFPYRSRTEISGLAASADALAWLQPGANGRWSVKVLLGSPVAGVSVASFLPGGPAWSAFRFASMSAGADNTAPVVTASSVTPGETDVSATESLRVYFSEPMDPTSVTSKTVILRDVKTGAKLGAKVRYSSLLKAAIVTPQQPLSGSYTLAVSPGVKDTAGNATGSHFAATFSTASFVEAGLPPDRVNNVIAVISDATGKVRVSWDPSTDPDGDMLGYQVKRFATPANTPAGFSAAATLTPDSGPMTIASSATSATFAPAADEVQKTSVYYYAVVAVDAAGNYSSVWYNSSPNPHGGELVGMNTNTCLKCHTAHTSSSGGMLGARGAESCYECHGGTSQSAAAGAYAINNVQAQFFDYPYTDLSPAQPSAPSRHGNAYTRQAATAGQCDMCHAPHKRSYNSNQAISYRKLLKRSQLANDATSTPVVYSADNAPMGKVLCLQCHGTDGDEATTQTAPYSNMYYYGGPTAYANTAGQHNGANWDGTTATVSAAHGTQNLNDAARALPYGGSLPANACQVCHAEHGSESPSLLAYRRSATTTQLGEAGLCLKCHGAGPEANSPNNWTRTAPTGAGTIGVRNVANEFARSSRHPITTVSGGISAAAVTHTSDTDFGTYALSSTSISGTGVSASLALSPLGLGYATAGTAVSGAVTNSSGTLQGWTDLTVNGVEPGSSSVTIDVLDGATDATFDGALTGIAYTATPMVIPLTTVDKNAHPSLKIRFNLASPAGVAASTADNFDDNAFDVTAPEPAWKDAILGSTDPDAGTVQDLIPVQGFETTGWTTDFPTTNGEVTRSTTAWTSMTGTASLRLQGGGTAPDWAQSRVLDAAGWTGVTVTFSYNSNTLDAGEWMRVQYSTDTNGTTWTDGWSLNGNSVTQQGTNGTFTIPSPTSTTRIRLVLSTGSGTTEYAYFDQVRVYGTSPNTTIWPNESGQLLTLRAEGTGMGTAVASDEGDYVYLDPAASTWISGSDFDARVRYVALRNNTTTTRSGLMIRTGALEANAAAADAEMAGVFVTNGTAAFQYRATAGTNAATNGGTVAASGPPRWLRLVRSGSTFTGYVSADGTAWTQVGTPRTLTIGALDAVLVGLGLTSGANGNFSEADFDDFSITQLNAPAASTPQVNDVTVGWTYIPDPSGTSTCYSCHNTHFVAEGTANTAWEKSRVSNPQDTNALYTGTITDFCLGCHGVTPGGDGSVNIAAVTNSANALVPFNVGMRPVSSWPFFTGWSKSGFTASAHGASAATAVKCEACHDPHGSNNPALTAWTRPGTASWQTNGTPPVGTRANTATVDAFEENLCYKCHGNVSAAANGRGLANNTVDIYTPFQSTYRHPVASGTQGTPVHSDQETKSDLLTKRHAECADCHDPHNAASGNAADNSSVAGNVLRGVVGVRPTAWPANWTTVPGANWTVEKLDGQTSDYEAYLCLKCHSSYLDPTGYGTTAPMTISTNTGGATYRQTDLALEFNPNNQSGHNILGTTSVFPKTTVAQGLPYSFGAPDLNLNTTLGFSDTAATYNQQKVTCSDCHSYDGTGAIGPHGSGSKFMVDAPTAGQTANWYTTQLGNWGTSNFLCRKCHTSMTTNTTHSNHSSRGLSCERCHVRIPHGWKRPRLLRRATVDQLPYSDPGVTGLTAIEYMNYSGDVSSSDCSDNCGRHSSAGTAWP